MNKKITIALIVMIMCVALTGCTEISSTEKAETEAVTENMEEMNRQVGMPNIDNFYEKKMAKRIFELRDNADLITYAYTVNLEGQYIYLGRCMGFGLPYSVQYTSPEKLVNRYGSAVRSTNEAFIVPQADPNGLYMPTSSSATWLMLINEETGDTEIVYMEPTIVVRQSKMPRRLVAEWSLPEDY